MMSIVPAGSVISRLLDQYANRSIQYVDRSQLLLLPVRRSCVGRSCSVDRSSRFSSRQSVGFGKRQSLSISMSKRPGTGSL
jgi:hypothetical protein